ncbi:TetR family transcriptional regulator [Glaciihabitans tibetensis]|uniref:TetR family transcriptional regulator n=1 Tax=Glaciihabitans tibetensis TaxID=1266600 RepID=A0A2T0VF92_9MICO|nr:TetR family transcriptional regulator [Glaciihabitans tibetensis]PRY68836.1 TetR family transcriptional regulator [Glaciihabitans tibetensis]
MASTKIRALDAGIELVGTEGLRALTHVRVDDRAALPRGSTSNWFRTRDALFSGVIDHIVDREMAAVTARAPVTAAELVEQLAALVEFTTGENRTLTTARLALFMEASHNPTLRQSVAAGRAAMEASMHAVLQRLGVGESHRVAAAAAIMACAEGQILHRIARGDTSDPRPTFDVVVRGALG